MNKFILFSVASLMSLSLVALAGETTSPLNTKPDPKSQVQKDETLRPVKVLATLSSKKKKEEALSPVKVVATRMGKKKRIVKPYAVYPERVLPVEIRYKSQPQNVQDALAEISKGLKDIKGAHNAIPVEDKYYETRLFSYKLSPYIPVSLYTQVVASHACDLNGHDDVAAPGPCIVVEKDSATGKTKTRAYFIAAAPGRDAMKIARVDVDQKKFSKHLDTLLSDKLDGVFIYSAADRSDEVMVPQQQPAPQPEPVYNFGPQDYVSNATYLLAKNVKIKGIDTEEQKMAYWHSVENLVRDYTYDRDPAAPPSGLNSCWIEAEMKQTRAWIILDVVGLVHGSDTPSRVSTKAVLHCKQASGETAQDVPVKVSEAAHFRMGFVFSPAKTKLLTVGLGGYANGALDILTIHNFASVVQGCVDLPFVSACVTPVILSNQPDRDGVLASSLINATVHKQVNLNATVSVGDSYTIEGDLSYAKPAAETFCLTSCSR